MRLCPSYLGVESPKEDSYCPGLCYWHHLCVCQRSHPLDLYHQSRGRSISPKGGYTIKNRREILGKKNNRSLADHCFAPQHTDPPTPSHTHFHFQSFSSYIMQHSTYSCKRLHAFPGSLTTCWDSTEFWCPGCVHSPTSGPGRSFCHSLTHPTVDQMMSFKHLHTLQFTHYIEMWK